MTPPLAPAEIQQVLSALSDWASEGGSLVKTFTFGSFREAFSFMTRVALEAEMMDHHSTWTNVYNRVTVRLNTHSAGDKITAKAVELARKIQQISWVG